MKSQHTGAVDRRITPVTVADTVQGPVLRAIVELASRQTPVTDSGHVRITVGSSHDIRAVAGRFSVVV